MRISRTITTNDYAAKALSQVISRHDDWHEPMFEASALTQVDNEPMTRSQCLKWQREHPVPEGEVHARALRSEATTRKVTFTVEMGPDFGPEDIRKAAAQFLNPAETLEDFTSTIAETQMAKPVVEVPQTKAATFYEVVALDGSSHSRLLPRRGFETKSAARAWATERATSGVITEPVAVRSYRQCLGGSIDLLTITPVVRKHIVSVWGTAVTYGSARGGWAFLGTVRN